MATHCVLQRKNDVEVTGSSPVSRCIIQPSCSGYENVRADEYLAVVASTQYGRGDDDVSGLTSIHHGQLNAHDSIEVSWINSVYACVRKLVELRSMEC